MLYELRMNGKVYQDTNINNLYSKKRKDVGNWVIYSVHKSKSDTIKFSVRKQFTQDEIDSMITHYKRGYAKKTICKKYKISIPTLERIFKKEKITT